MVSVSLFVVKMSKLPVAERANFKIFQQVLYGTSVRVGDFFYESASRHSQRHANSAAFFSN